MANEQITLNWWEQKKGISRHDKIVAAEKKQKRLDRRAQEKYQEELKNRQAEHAASRKNGALKNSSFGFSVKKEGALFDLSCLGKKEIDLVNNFDRIIESVFPLNSKQRSLLPEQIRSLSHNLTDTRSDRRLGYMNQTTTLSSYINYYLWWNLVRLTRLFANLPADYFNLKDESVCLDIGSGPLTLPMALFIARPELRSKKLTFYCMDISSASLAAGENLFLSVAAALESEPWRIVRVKGNFGTVIKEKADMVCSANVFNEVVQDFKMPPEYNAKKIYTDLMAYGKKDGETKYLVIEPGVPATARFISLLRDYFVNNQYSVCAPCCHEKECPMDGRKGGKWCNYAFSTEDAPAKLKKLSAAAKLPKERAVLSFVAATRKTSVQELQEQEEKSLQFRIASDPIRLPGDRTGYYACSRRGLLLVTSADPLASGELYSADMPHKNLAQDKKSGALVLPVKVGK